MMRTRGSISVGHSLAIFFGRVTLGAYFGAAGVKKVFEVGVGTFYDESYLKMAPQWLPQAINKVYGQAIPYLELVLGVLLIAGLLTRLAGLLTFGMLVSFTIALMMAKGPSGGGPVYFHVNVVLCAVALGLVLTGGGGLSVDRVLLRDRSEVGPEED